MRFRITPRDGSFFELLSKAASYLVPASDLLSRILTSPDKAVRKELLSGLQAAQADADEASREVIRKANATFVTPIDRDDLHAIASGLVDCIDGIEEAADLIVLYEMDTVPGNIIGLVDVIGRASELTHEAMPKFARLEDLAEYWVETRRLERRADKLHRKLVAKIFNEVEDLKTLLQLKEICDSLENTMDMFDQLADVVETVALKEA